ncbi:MAG TPA: hypothetical protein GX723_04205 [Thermoanaerobacterales bacterium]|jgi:hypothetical protein|nr:hypothetical protein [Thermoanaerobacterales bacterium]
MQVGIELCLQTGILITDDRFIRLKISNNGKIMENSFSEDAFGFFGMMIPGKRLAGVGRKRYYGGNQLMGRIFEADSASPVNFIFVDPEDDIKLIVETNIWLDPGVMVQELSLKVYTDKKTLDIPLNRPDIKLNWLSRGTFAIEISEYIKELYAARVKI